MKLYEFIATLELGENEYDTYYQLIVAKNENEAQEKFNDLIGRFAIRILEDSIKCFEIKEIDGYKIKVED